MKNKSALLFYLGTLISSVGSLAFTICLLAFMLKDGTELFYASLIIGLSRLIPVVISTLWGQAADQLPPKLTVLVTELLAATASFGILLSWNHGKGAYWLLLIFCVLKSSVVTFQAGSRAKPLTNPITGRAKLMNNRMQPQMNRFSNWYSEIGLSKEAKKLNKQQKGRN
ncbi:MAG: hypothetical protein AABY64_09585 [Bdellovibrionota bacterium]